MILTEKSKSFKEKVQGPHLHPSPTQTDLESKSVVRGERPAFDNIKCGTILYIPGHN